MKFNFKIINKNDSFIDVIHKISTIIGVIFGIWAYFHSIHPVFEKELELQKLRGEKEKLIKSIKELEYILDKTKKEKVQVIKNLQELQIEKEKLINQISVLKKNLIVKEKELKKLNRELQSASEAAILNKLYYFSNKIINAYLLHIATNNTKEFDVIKIAKEILNTHKKEFKNIYEKQAYDYFFSYVKRHENEKFSGDKIIEFAIRLPLEYKIQKIQIYKKQQISNTPPPAAVK